MGINRLTNDRFILVSRDRRERYSTAEVLEGVPQLGSGAAMRQHADRRGKRSLILRRLLHPINNHKLARSLRRFQFQPQLLLDRGKNRRTIGRIRSRGLWKSRLGTWPDSEGVQPGR